MVVSKKPEMLRTAATWIKRLDHADTERTSVHVYQVKYGDARQIARVLNDMFTGGSSSSNLLDSPDNQLAPGSGTSTTSSGFAMNSNPSTGSNPSASTSGFGTNGFGGQGGSGSGGLGAATGPGARGAKVNGADALDAGRGASSGNGQPLLQDVRITPDAVNNTLLIYADQANYRSSRPPCCRSTSRSFRSRSMRRLPR